MASETKHEKCMCVAYEALDPADVYGPCACDHSIEDHPNRESCEGEVDENGYAV